WDRHLLFFEADDRLELINHNLNRLRESVIGRDGAIGLNEELQTIEVCTITHAHVVYFVASSTNGGEDGIKSDGTNFYAILLKYFLLDEAETLLDMDLHFKRGVLAGDSRDVLFWVKYFHLPWELDVGRSHRLLTLNLK